MRLNLSVQLEGIWWEGLSISTYSTKHTEGRPVL